MSNWLNKRIIAAILTILFAASVTFFPKASKVICTIADTLAISIETCEDIE